MKALVLVLVLAGFASADPKASVRVPERAITSIVGCWKSPSERWTFVREADSGISVVREIDPSAAEAKRARLPHPVKFVDGSYGFEAAGRIHALMFIGHLENGQLEASVYSSREPGQWSWNGNTVTLKRC